MESYWGDAHILASLAARNFLNLFISHGGPQIGSIRDANCARRSRVHFVEMQSYTHFGKVRSVYVILIESDQGEYA